MEDRVGMTDQTSAPKSCSCLALALDRLRVLHELEGVYYVLPSTTRSSSRPIGRGSSGEGRYVTTLPESRSKISSWGYDVVDHFGFPREAVSWMMYYIDRILLQRSPSEGPSHREFLLLSLTAFYLAVKLVCNPSRGGSFPIMNAVLGMSKNQFTADQVAGAERQILEALGYRVHPPTPDRYLQDLVELCCYRCVANDSDAAMLRLQRERVHDYSLYLIELSVLDHFFLHYKPSEIAVAALYNARDVALARSAEGLAVNDSIDARRSFFASDPFHVMIGCLRPGTCLEPARIGSCRVRFAHMIQQQIEQQQLTLPDFPTSLRNDGNGSDDSSSALRTVSPVSVHPHDPANCPDTHHYCRDGFVGADGDGCHGAETANHSTDSKISG